jgi:CheY-like chemotaxis protein
MAKTLSKPHICLVCWNADLAAERAKLLGNRGFQVTVVSASVSGWITYFRNLALDAVMIDLDKLPSHGREVGTLLRGSKSTRHLPLIFLGGPADKVERIRAELPDASFASWDNPAGFLSKAISTQVAKPIRPTQMMERSHNHDLARKLGIKAGVPVILWGDTHFLADLLSDAAKCIPFRGRLQPRSLCLCVTRRATDVDAVFGTMTSAYSDGALLWIIHPKKTSRYATDFNQNDVRSMGLSHGWVDFKVCAVDHDWSGLEFARRRSPDQLKPRSMKHAAKMPLNDLEVKVVP